MKKTGEDRVCVNDPSNEPDPIDHSNPLTDWPPVGKENKRKPLRGVWRLAICFMLLFMAVTIIVVILTKG